MTPSPARRHWRKLLLIPVALVAAASIVAVPPLPELQATPAPVAARTYEDAITRLSRLEALDGPEVHPLCRTALLTHGEKRPYVAVLLHGYTNCPQQYVALAPALHERGWNVVMPRMPRNGLSDRLGKGLEQLTAEELAAFADEVAGLAHGLGERVVVVGFSAGGTLAAWIAQRQQAHRVVLVSPCLGIVNLGPAMNAVAARVLSRLPDRHVPWRPERPGDPPGPAHAYAGFSTRGLAQILRLSGVVQASPQPPVAREIVVVNNPSDAAVDEHSTRALVQQWRERQANLRVHEFAAGWHLTHDLLDPKQARQQVARVYPVLLGWITDGLE